MSLFEVVCCLRIRKPQFSLLIFCLSSLCWVPGAVCVGVGGVGGGLSLGVDVGVVVFLGMFSCGWWCCHQEKSHRPFPSRPSSIRFLSTTFTPDSSSLSMRNIFHDCLLGKKRE